MHAVHVSGSLKFGCLKIKHTNMLLIFLAGSWKFEAGRKTGNSDFQLPASIFQIFLKRSEVFKNIVTYWADGHD